METSTAIERPLPHSIEAERCILGAVLLDNRAFGEIEAENLRGDHFFLSQHRLLFEGMEQLRESEQPIDTLTLPAVLEKRDTLERAGGHAYISGLAHSEPPHVSSVPFYLRLVKQKKVLRDLIHATAEIREEALADADDVERILARAESKFASVRATAGFVADAESLLFPDAPKTLLDGVLGEICAKRFPRFPVAYAWPALLTVAGCLVPTMPDIRTNLYCALVGEVGTGKSQTIQRAIRVLGLSAPVLEETMAGSAEGLYAKIENADGEARLISPDELGHLLTKAKIDNASLPFVLNTGYYSTRFDLTIARGRVIRVNSSISFIGGVVASEFGNCFGATTTAGLHDRFIFGLCPSPFDFQYRPFEGGTETADRCRVAIAPEVWEVRAQWQKEIKGLTPRHAEHALRAAVVCASFSGRTILRAADLAPARAFAEYQARVRMLLKPNPGENTDARCAFQIKDTLEENGGWMKKRDLSRKIHSDRFGPSAFERALKSLAFSGEVEVTEKRPASVRLVPG